MADKKTIDKVKELLETNAYAPLKEAAEKWLAAADEKYGDKFEEFKEKSSEAFEKLGDKAEEFAGKSIEANEKLAEARDKVTESYDKFVEKAGPAIDDFMEKAAPVVEELKEKAAPKIDELMEKAAPTIEKISDNEFVKQLKESISTFTENIEFFSSDAAKEKFGAEAAEQIRKHAEEMKAQGKTYCDCPACTKAREILKDLGADLEEPEA